MPRKKQERIAPIASDAAPEQTQTNEVPVKTRRRTTKPVLSLPVEPTAEPAETSPSAAPVSAKPRRQRKAAPSPAEPVAEAPVSLAQDPSPQDMPTPEPTVGRQPARATRPGKKSAAAPESGPSDSAEVSGAAPTPKTTRRSKKAPVSAEPDSPVVEAKAPEQTPEPEPTASPAPVSSNVEASGEAVPELPTPEAPAKRKPGRPRRTPVEVPAPIAAAPASPEPTQPEPEASASPVTTRPQRGAHRGRRPAADAGDVQPEAAQAGTDQGEAQTPPPVTLLTDAQTGEDIAELESGAEPQAATNVSPPLPRKRGRPAREKAPSARRELPVQEDTAEQAAAPATPPATSGAHTVSDEARELIIQQLRKLGRPVHVRDFERTFTRQGREKLGVRRDLAGLLEDLTASGDVIRTRRHTYGLPEAMNLVRGRFQASSAGFGFVIPDSGGDDFYIREGETLEAWNGDIVLIRPEGRGSNDRYSDRSNERGGNRGGNRRNDSPRAAVVRIVKRAYSQLVGSLDHQQTYAFLKPDDHRARHRIMLMPGGTEALPNGARVVAQLFWPEHTGEDEVYGEIVRVLGNEDDPATETQAVIVKYGLRDEFPDDVLREAERIPRQVPEEALRGRLDLRDYNIFTVDGSDAKDFDDAIHIQATPEGTFVVGVHIADVSHYVRPGTPLDEEAYARATSVYLPGAVLPMLPEHLSNGVCSLVPGEDRLTMSAMLELSGDGEILTAAFTPSVIRSKARLTYDEVQAYSEAVATLQGDARVLEGDLHLLLKITAKLRQKRLREGSLDFKLREVKVDVGKDGHMQLIPIREETARGMIEDLMLLANKAVAHFLLEKNVPTLFRIHEEPTLARFQEVTGAIGRMGLAFPGGEPTPQAYQAVLKAVRGTGQESAVNTLLLRSMQQAKYAEENLGHFGLAFEEYLHFTSPIRRYPDLLVHRALKAALDGPVSDRQRGDLAAPLAEQGRHTSERERTAAEAERDLTKYYQAKWAQEHLGESFEGRVSGVIASGLFVVLENGVEGRLHISNLDDDYYFYIEDASILKGRTSGRIYRIGENIEVTISSVNPLARQIDFTQENTMDGNDNRPRARRREDREAQKREKLSSFLPRKDGDPETPASAAPDQSGQPQAPRREAQPSGQNGPRREGGRPERPNERPRRDGPGGYQRASGGFRRRVVTLDRPRNEHLRPVNVTVQRMYFGDWTLDNMPPEEGQGGQDSPRQQGGTFRGRSAPASGPRGGERPRSGGQGNAQGRRPQQAARPQQPQSEVPAASAPGESAASDDARRRRRRRGRRGGNGPSS
ncbi:ribonuclease R [Deinococcus irradiatisoli]|uniref:ribonuclease R n=1 Tax=Deinococcus irradiatisoli TaxID=2202254 RepID=UPI001FEBCAF5|nr:ribonuclease R [Deinococcus irradiatisoli]